MSHNPPPRHGLHSISVVAATRILRIGTLCLCCLGLPSPYTFAEETPVPSEIERLLLERPWFGPHFDQVIRERFGAGVASGNGEERNDGGGAGLEGALGRRWQELEQTDPRFALLRGMLAEFCSDFEGASHHFARAGDSSDWALFHRARLAAFFGDEERADALLAQAQTESSDTLLYPHLVRSRSDRFSLAGDYEGALGVYEEAWVGGRDIERRLLILDEMAVLLSRLGRSRQFTARLLRDTISDRAVDLSPRERRLLDEGDNGDDGVVPARSAPGEGEDADVRTAVSLILLVEAMRRFNDGTELSFLAAWTADPEFADVRARFDENRLLLSQYPELLRANYEKFAPRARDDPDGPHPPDKGWSGTAPAPLSTTDARSLLSREWARDPQANARLIAETLPHWREQPGRMLGSLLLGLKHDPEQARRLRTLLAAEGLFEGADAKFRAIDIWLAAMSGEIETGDLVDALENLATACPITSVASSAYVRSTLHAPLIADVEQSFATDVLWNPIGEAHREWRRQQTQRFRLHVLTRYNHYTNLTLGAKSAPHISGLAPAYRSSFFPETVRHWCWLMLALCAPDPEASLERILARLPDPSARLSLAARAGRFGVLAREIEACEADWSAVSTGALLIALEELREREIGPLRSPRLRLLQVVLERHPEWRNSPQLRDLAGWRTLAMGAVKSPWEESSQDFRLRDREALFFAIPHPVYRLRFRHPPVQGHARFDISLANQLTVLASRSAFREPFFPTNQEAFAPTGSGRPLSQVPATLPFENRSPQIDLFRSAKGPVYSPLVEELFAELAGLPFKTLTHPQFEDWLDQEHLPAHWRKLLADITQVREAVAEAADDEARTEIVLEWLDSREEPLVTLAGDLWRQARKLPHRPEREANREDSFWQWLQSKMLNDDPNTPAGRARRTAAAPTQRSSEDRTARTVSMRLRHLHRLVDGPGGEEILEPGGVARFTTRISPELDVSYLLLRQRHFHLIDQLPDRLLSPRLTRLVSHWLLAGELELPEAEREQWLAAARGAIPRDPDRILLEASGLASGGPKDRSRARELFLANFHGGALELLHANRDCNWFELFEEEGNLEEFARVVAPATTGGLTDYLARFAQIKDQCATMAAQRYRSVSAELAKAIMPREDSGMGANGAGKKDNGCSGIEDARPLVDEEMALDLSRIMAEDADTWKTVCLSLAENGRSGESVLLARRILVETSPPSSRSTSWDPDAEPDFDPPGSNYRDSRNVDLNAWSRRWPKSWMRSGGQEGDLPPSDAGAELLHLLREHDPDLGGFLDAELVRNPGSFAAAAARIAIACLDEGADSADATVWLEHLSPRAKTEALFVVASLVPRSKFPTAAFAEIAKTRLEGLVDGRYSRRTEWPGLTEEETSLALMLLDTGEERNFQFLVSLLPRWNALVSAGKSDRTLVLGVRGVFAERWRHARVHHILTGSGDGPARESHAIQLAETLWERGDRKSAAAVLRQIHEQRESHFIADGKPSPRSEPDPLVSLLESRESGPEGAPREIPADGRKWRDGEARPLSDMEFVAVLRATLLGEPGRLELQVRRGPDRDGLPGITWDLVAVTGTPDAPVRSSLGPASDRTRDLADALFTPERLRFLRSDDGMLWEAFAEFDEPLAGDPLPLDLPPSGGFLRVELVDANGVPITEASAPVPYSTLRPLAGNVAEVGERGPRTRPLDFEELARSVEWNEERTAFWGLPLCDPLPVAASPKLLLTLWRPLPSPPPDAGELSFVFVDASGAPVHRGPLAWSGDALRETAQPLRWSEHRVVIAPGSSEWRIPPEANGLLLVWKDNRRVYFTPSMGRGLPPFTLAPLAAKAER